MSPASVTTLPQALLTVRGLTVQYKTPDHLVTAVHRVTFDVHAGDRFVILGPSGCGKSTLLKSIAGFLPPVEGEICLEGRPVRRAGPDRIMVFQEFDQLLPWKTVRENIVFPLVETGRPRAEALARADDQLNRVGLTKFADLFPHMLSGGMKQRVAIARAMALEPKVLLMDEPFAALDALTRNQMQDELLRLWEDIGFTLIFVTHSIEEAIVVGSRVLLLSPHPGQVRAELNVPPASVERRGGEAQTALGHRIHELLFGAQAAPGARQAIGHG
jgi:NitT/TauT family transport system ATP-binding protein